MRPEALFGLFSDISVLDGVGKKTTEGLESLCGRRVIDILKHIPRDYTQRVLITDISQGVDGQYIICPVTIQTHKVPPRHSKAPYRLVCTDGTDILELIYFKAGESYMKKNYPVGEIFFVSGKLEMHNAQIQIIHPDYIVKESAHIPVCSPIYTQSGQVSSKLISRIMGGVLSKVPTCTEWTDASLLQKHGWMDFKSALHTLHTPKDTKHIETARRRLAYDELLASQITIAISRSIRNKNSALPIFSDGLYCQKMLETLPYDITNAQKNAIQHIIQDMAKNTPMNRLLQGDVGSGKTLVALMAMLHATQCGMQSVIIAPTEVLANQHATSIQETLNNTRDISVNIEILTGKTKGKTRAEILHRLAQGDIHILVGTHAVFQDDVIYQNLNLCVIDEQHRFGVEQRSRLMAKAKNPHVLSMTATPIPRTLLMTAFGDMDWSQLDEKPVGRKPIETRVMPDTKLNDIIHALHRILQSDKHVYWVCPLVEESEKIDVTAAQDRYASLCHIFGEDTVVLVHGKMKALEKQSAMDRFVSGQAKIMVATTVIEVGVNVPNATVMIIEQAERFGLSQLHQLRGRVGRNSYTSSCILLYKTLNPISQKRLQVIRDTNDGFYIAEQDLKLRGPGDILGTKQSGVPVTFFADILHDSDLLAIAQKDAQYILHQDPTLDTPRGNALRTLLYIFEREHSLIGI